jgi:hypothetical protein
VLRLLVAALAAGGLTIGSVPSASAFINNCGTHGNYWDGYGYNSHANTDDFEGASGYIVVRPIYTCNTDTSSPDPAARKIGSNVSANWIMIADYNSAGWSQAGEIGGYNGIGYAWAEVAGHYDSATGLCTDCFDRFATTVTSGDRDAFTEKYQYCGAPTNGYCIESLFNGSRITDTDFNPFTTYWAQWPGSGPGWQPEFSGEKSYQENDIIGTSSQHANFEYIGAQRYSDNAFENMPCELVAVDTATRATYQASSCYNFDIWTTSSS